MKLLLLLVLFVSAALAQVPTPAQVAAHSVVGNLTIDVTDIQIPVPYGSPETKAMVTVCSSVEVTNMQIYITSGTPEAQFNSVQDFLVSKAGSAYCGSVVATAERAKITYILANSGSQARIVPVQPPATSGSTAAPRR